MEEWTAYFPLIRHGPHRKRRLQQFFVAAGTYLPNYLPSNGRGIHRPFFDKTQAAFKMMRTTILLLFRLVVAAGTCSPNRCLAPKGKIRVRTLNRAVALPLIGSIHAHAQRLMGRIYEVRRWDWLRFHHKRTKFRIDWFSYSEVDGGGGGTQTPIKGGAALA
jgi:hypothetical protein